MVALQSTVKRIVVVDDEEKLCTLVSRFLTERGYEVATATNGTQALAEIERLRPEVVLLDVIMPGLTGIELLKLIRDRAFPPRVIMVTANDEQDIARQAMQEGAEAYMCKPVNFDELDRVISRIFPANQPPSASTA